MGTADTGGKAPIGTRLPQLESTRLYRRIADLLETRIEQGLFPVGTFLPAERELAEQLGVSRTSVREALIALEVNGRVVIRQGHGVQVLATAQSVEDTTPPDVDIGPIQVLEARRLIEPRIAELAATNHGPQNLENMRAAMALQGSASTWTADAYREGDRRFHVEIARASGNAAFEVLVAKLWEYRTKPLFERFENLLVGSDRIGRTVTEHEAIYDAIASGNSAEAGKAMRGHVEAVLSSFVKGTPG
ncbi:FadR/GntR family transcriptional regulator [Devosia sp. 2618]|uniref:FadR/GntR family transcriptional regulator n=1 Tax=Devosia sp. 2618 TaxID=3156454 RepID=UPI0033914C7D